MKRPHSKETRKHVGTSGDIKADLSKDQLAELGACALAYKVIVKAKKCAQFPFYFLWSV